MIKRVLQHLLPIALCMPLSLYADTLSLKEMLETALTKNPQVIKAQIDQTLYEMNIDVQKDHWKPTWLINVYGDIESTKRDTSDSNQRKSLNISPTMVFKSILGTEVNLQATQIVSQEHDAARQQDLRWYVHFEQPLLKGVRPLVNKAPLKEAEFQQKMGQHQQQDTTSYVILSLLQQYVSLYCHWQNLKIQEQRLKTQEMHSKIIAQKVATGRIAEVDGMMHELQLARLEQGITQTRMSLLKMSAQLGSLMGEKLESPQRLEPIQVNDLISLEPAEYIEKAKAQHLDPIEWQLDHLKYEENVIRDGYQWDLRVKGTWSLGRRSLYYDDELLKDDPEYFIFTHHQKYLGLFLTVPLGKNKSRDLNLYQNKSGQYKKRLDLENAVLTLDSKVRDSFQQVAYWQKQKDIAKSAYLLAKRALDIEEQKYLVGRTSLLDWQRAQEMEMQVAMDQISTEMGYFLAQVELDYVSGLLPVRWQSYVG